MAARLRFKWSGSFSIYVVGLTLLCWITWITNSEQQYRFLCTASAAGHYFKCKELIKGLQAVMYINAHAFLLPLYLHICVFLWKNVIHYVPCSSSSVLMQPLIIPNLSPSLPLSEPLCPRYSPPSYNDLVITGAAFPALVSRGVWGLIGTEWVRVCVAVRPDWHRTGIQGYPLQELYYRVYIQALTLKHSTSTNKKCFEHTNTCMFKCVVYSKTLYFYFWVVLFIKCAKTCCFFCPPC